MIRLFGFIAIFLCAIAGATLGVWYKDTILPYEYLRGEISPNPANQSAMVQVKWDISPARRLCPGTVLRRLYNLETGKLVGSYDRTPASISVEVGDTELIKTFRLPDVKLPEHIRYTADVCFSCNPLRVLFPVCTRTPDLTFDVGPRD